MKFQIVFIFLPFLIHQIWKIKFFTIPGLAELFNLKNKNHESCHLAHSLAKANKKDSIKLKNEGKQMKGN